MQKILVIEDDERIRDELVSLLAENGYQAESIQDFSCILPFIKEFIPHIILLDINLPSANGLQICTDIRTFSDVPIIFVTARNTAMDELDSILRGGDAFITKPYNVAILLAKIASLLRRTYPLEQKPYLEYNHIVLRLDRASIEFQEKQAELTKNELKILYYLFQNPGKICSRNELIEFLWDNQLYIDDNTLSVNITRIREKLSSIGIRKFIKTRHRQGYII